MMIKMVVVRRACLHSPFVGFQVKSLHWVEHLRPFLKLPLKVYLDNLAIIVNLTSPSISPPITARNLVSTAAAQNLTRTFFSTNVDNETFLCNFKGFLGFTSGMSFAACQLSCSESHLWNKIFFSSHISNGWGLPHLHWETLIAVNDAAKDEHVASHLCVSKTQNMQILADFGLLLVYPN